MVEEILYQHLLPSIREMLLRGDQAEIIKHIFSEHWIGYELAQKALLKLSDLYTYPKRKRMPNLLIIGPTNNGKTMIVEKFKRNYLPKESADSMFSTYENYPVLSLQMPPSPEVKRFYAMILYQLGLTVPGNAKYGRLETEILSQLQDHDVKMIIIDEIHNILVGRSEQQREFLNVLRFLGNELSVPLVCLGTKDAYLAIRSDDQLENRFEPFLLPIWKAGDELNSLLASFVRLMPLKHESNLTEPKIVEKILIMSEGILGEIAAIIMKSAKSAFLLGHNEINESLLSSIDYRSPSERKKIFERGL